MKTILLVESHSDIQCLIKIYLQINFDAHIRMAASEKTAIDAFNDTQVSLVILSNLSTGESARFVIIRSFLKLFKPEVPFVIFANPITIKNPIEDVGSYTTKTEFKDLVLAVKRLGLFDEISVSKQYGGTK